MKQISTLLFLLLSLASLSLADGKKPNVLLLMSDDLNTALSGFGHPQCKTPSSISWPSAAYALRTCTASIPYVVPPARR